MTDSLATAIETVPVAVIVSETSSHRIVAANAAAVALFGRTRDEFLSILVDDLTHPAYRAELGANYMRSLGPDGFTTLKWYLRGDGTSFMGQLRAAPTEGHPGLLSAVVTSVEELDSLRSAVLAAATTDELTGTLRRGAFLSAAALATTMQPAYGVLFLDLDNMKAINDTFGHDAGDEVLRTVAERIRSAGRQGDLVGRFGGDEFAVFVNDLGTARDLVRLANALHRRVTLPVAYRNMELPVGISIGAVHCSNQVTIDEAIERADETMYVTKARHRQGIHRPFEIPDIIVLDRD